MDEKMSYEDWKNNLIKLSAQNDHADVLRLFHAHKDFKSHFESLDHQDKDFPQVLVSVVVSMANVYGEEKGMKYILSLGGCNPKKA